MIGIRMSRMMASGATLSAISIPASADMAVATSKPLEFEDPRERIGHRPVVVDDEDRSSGRLGGMIFEGRNHCIILMGKDIHVKEGGDLL